MKPTAKRPTILLTCLFASALWADRTAVAETTKAQIEKAVGALAGYDYGRSSKPLRHLERMIGETHANADLRAHLENQLVKLLESDATGAGKQFVCRTLWRIGTDRSVPALASMLLDDKTAEMACYALASHPSDHQFLVGGVNT